MPIGWPGRGDDRGGGSCVIPISDDDIDRLIAEDVHFGDLTTRVLGIGRSAGQIRFIARDPMVACGTEEAARILARLGAAPRLHVGSAEVAPAGTLLLDATGEAAALHAGWKIAQSLMEWASGVATATPDIVDAARAVMPTITAACTRKTAPLTRGLSIKAVLSGGGTMHRTGLADTILVFPEHRAFLGHEDLAATLRRLRIEAPERAIVVEAPNEDDAFAAVAAGADVVQLEKFPPHSVAELKARLSHAGLVRCRIAAAGGVNAANAAAYAAAGADILVTSAPYAARARDVQVRLTAT